MTFIKKQSHGFELARPPACFREGPKHFRQGAGSLRPSLSNVPDRTLLCETLVTQQRSTSFQVNWQVFMLTVTGHGQL